MSSLPAKKDEF